MSLLTFLALLLNVVAACVCAAWFIEEYQAEHFQVVALVFTILNVICAIYNFIVLIELT